MMIRDKAHPGQSFTKKNDQSSDQNTPAYFDSLAKKIGFSELEITEMNKLYRSDLEEVKHEYRSGS